MIDKKKIEKAVKMILEGIGEDPNRAGIIDTPRRVAKMYEEIFSGIADNPEKKLEVLRGEEYDEIILIKDIPLYSMCEHHLIPFIGKAHIAYIPDGGKVIGLSKIVRVVEIFTKRLQVQERLTTQIADILMKALKPKGVIVVISAEHLCMSMRGVKKPGTQTVTSVVKGIFKNDQKTREEVFSLIKG